MSALPEYPTERDRERFQDCCKMRLKFLEPDFDRIEVDGHYRSLMAKDLWAVWWPVERERQMLQNLNQSQAMEIQRLINKIAQLERINVEANRPETARGSL
jgi:hypothetical protein